MTQAPGRRAWALAVLLLLTSAASAFAHAGSMAFWRITFQGAGARSQILVSLDDVSRIAPGLVSRAGPVPIERLGPFGATLLAHFGIEQAGTRVPARIVEAQVLSSGLLDVQVAHEVADDASGLALRATFHELTDDTHRVITRVDRRGRVASLVFHSAAATQALPEIRRASWRDAIAPAGSLRAMLLLGIEHILTGYDHLVFLACLLVPGGTWRSRVAIVSAFTAAHSLTLVLAATHVITPPARFVELAIALSIAYVAIENVVADAHRARWPTAFGFGLIHGLGFAGTLGALDLPVRQWLSAVLAFNLGVEIGQLAVVALVLPLIIVIAHSPWHRRVVQSTSAMVFGLAVVWFVERLQ